MQWVYFVLVISLTSTKIMANVYGHDELGVDKQAIWKHHIDQLKYKSFIDIFIQNLDNNIARIVPGGAGQSVVDGKITLEELRGRFGDVPVEAIIRKLDKNNDNAVDHTDLEIEVRKLSDAVVSMHDFDDNGFKTKNEATYSSNVFLATTVKGLELSLTFWFDLADLNNDGIISDSDFPKLAPFQSLKTMDLPLLKTIDVDEDYQISRTELTQLVTKMAETVDMNDDGAVNFQELLQSMIWFDLVDLNNDDFISDDDYPHLAPFQTLKTFIMKNKNSMVSRLASVLLKAIDVNEDYEISKTETIQFLTETMDKLDQNDDGTVTFTEVLKTMKEFKFPEKFVHQAEQIQAEQIQFINLFFDNFDADADGMINGNELSNVLTKPIPSSYLVEMQKFFVRPPNAYVEGTSEQEMNTTLASVSAFLKSSSSTARIKISFILICLAFFCSYLTN